VENNEGDFSWSMCELSLKAIDFYTTQQHTKLIQPCKPEDMYQNLMQTHEPIHNYQNIDTVLVGFSFA